MKNTLTLLLAIAASFALGFFCHSLIAKQVNNKVEVKQPKTHHTEKKVTGVGGIFFKCKEPAKVKDWYKTHLGFNVDDYGARFEWLEKDDTTKKGVTQWSLFKETGNYFAPSTKEFMINYRVENLVSLVEQLKKEDVTIVDQIETYEYGKFVHIMDIEGNKIELWEPNFEYGKKR
ncbi:MAG TPA: VOC family protein [Bacteroidia bacterium]|jgi:predicted enzyme related to lactoylglutathione lyase|nr:VOC family protein [Bacteroidia bacterium]